MIKTVGRVIRIVVVDNYSHSFLLVKSSDRVKSWELPGGKAKPEETVLEAGRRELYEETGLSPNIMRTKHTLIKPLPYDINQVHENHICACVYTHRPVVMIDGIEIIDYRWVTLTTARSLQAHLEWLSKYYISKIKNLAATKT